MQSELVGLNRHLAKQLGHSVGVELVELHYNTQVVWAENSQFGEDLRRESSAHSRREATALFPGGNLARQRVARCSHAGILFKVRQREHACHPVRHLDECRSEVSRMTLW